MPLQRQTNTGTYTNHVRQFISTSFYKGNHLLVHRLNMLVITPVHASTTTRAYWCIMLFITTAYISVEYELYFVKYIDRLTIATKIVKCVSALRQTDNKLRLVKLDNLFF